MILWELILTESYAAQILKISVAKTSKLAMMNHANIVKIKMQFLGSSTYYTSL